MKAEADGLYITLEPTERGEAVLRENPYLGCSARIVEQYKRSDGAYFPAAVQHTLGTLGTRAFRARRVDPGQPEQRNERGD